MKKITLTCALLFITYTFLFAQAKDSTAAWHYKTATYDCAIFPKTNTDYPLAGERFTPGFPDIDKAEHALQEQLLQQKDTTGRIAGIYRNLKKYKRQYFGYTDKNGHKILFINCFWDDKRFIKDWTSQMIMVDGGGSSYWKVRYDLTTNKLYGLQINNAAE